MLLVGVTGGIGSGKSIVCKVLEELDYPVFHSDKIAKELLNSNKELKQDLINNFGVNLYDNDSLNRNRLAEIIFSNPDARNIVNELVHPKVRESFEQFVNHCNKSIVFNEAAILFETGSYLQFNKNILITAPEELRLKRVCYRDNSSVSEVLARMKTQWSDEKKTALADYIIVNDDLKPVLNQIELILEELLTLPQ